MNKVITVSRAFGSGGRELGKRLAELLGIAYYDHEIISGIAQKSGLAEAYVNSVVDRKVAARYPITIGRTFSNAFDPQLELNLRIYTQQCDIIKELASRSDCLLIGRCSDHILRECRPFNMFVHADMDARVHRCREKEPAGENLSDAALKGRILETDRGRAQYYKFWTEREWGAKEHYALCVNTTHMEIRDLALPLSGLLKALLYNE